MWLLDSLLTTDLPVLCSRIDRDNCLHHYRAARRLRYYFLSIHQFVLLANSNRLAYQLPLDSQCFAQMHIKILGNRPKDDGIRYFLTRYTHR
jgi:hypothetical protein